MRVRTNSKPFLKKNFPELLNYKRTASRMYEEKEKPGHKDDWWFKFTADDLENNEYIIFAGALDYINKNFKILKVPSSYIKANADKLYWNDAGWIIIYLHFKDLIDLRNSANLSFKGFELN